MRVFIEFCGQFLFFVHFWLPNKFFSFKNRKLFLETKNKRKKQLPNIHLLFIVQLSIIFVHIHQPQYFIKNITDLPLRPPKTPPHHHWSTTSVSRRERRDDLSKKEREMREREKRDTRRESLKLNKKYISFNVVMIEPHYTQ